MKVMISFELDVPEIIVDNEPIQIPVMILSKMIHREWEYDTADIIQDYLENHCPYSLENENFICDRVCSDTISCWRRRFGNDNRKTRT